MPKVNRYYTANKYHNRKVTVDGITFDSTKECRRYLDLKLLERCGKISNLELQKRFELIPAQYEPSRVGVRGGTIKGKLLERAVAYIADFVYIENGKLVVEDTKGMRTAEYKIKRKLMLYKYGIRIREL